MLKALLLACVVYAMPVHAEEEFGTWHPPSKLEMVPMVLTVGLIWADVLQTRDGLRHGRYEENVFLGKHPSDAKLVLVGGVLPTIALTLIWYALPSPHRSVFLIGPLAAEGELVWENADKGLVIRF